MGATAVVSWVLCAVGTVVAFYKSYKALKPGTDREYSLNVLRFWSMFGMLEVLGCVMPSYNMQLKVALTFFCFWNTEKAAIKPLFVRTVVPLFKAYGGPADLWIKRQARVVASRASALYRRAATAGVRGVLAEASAEDLAKLEVSLSDALEVAGRERRRRRTAALRHSLSPHPRTPRRRSADVLREDRAGEGKDGADGEQDHKLQEDTPPTPAGESKLGASDNDGGSLTTPARPTGDDKEEEDGWTSEEDDVMTDDISWVQVPRHPSGEFHSYTPAGATSAMRQRPGRRGYSLG